jgi:pyruvate dehydrogenase E2 component (dihydrolipoamide acetyltransferase)
VFEFKLPDLGEGIHEGEILKWYVEPGQHVEEDAPLVDVETDKAAVTIPSPRAGKIEKVQPDVGSTVEVGQVIAVIDEEGEGGGEEAEEKPAEDEKEGKEEEPAEKKPEKAEPEEKEDKEEKKKKEEPKKKKQPEKREEPEKKERPAEKPAPAEAPRREGPVPAAPAVRKLARELGVDINRVPGQGPAGRVRAEDVRAFASGEAAPERAEEAPEAAPAAAGGGAAIPFFELESMPDFESFGEVEREQIRSIRRKVAKKMVTSMVAVPHVAHMDDADVTELEAFRRKERDKREGDPGGRLTLLPFVIKAVTRCLAEFPAFNASLDPFRGEIVYKKYFNVGFATDTERGLLVPVVHGTDEKSILEISAEVERLAGKARDGSISVPEMQGGNFSITNVGPLGGTRLIPTINYPEVAILGMGRAAKQPVVIDDEIAVRVILPLTLAFDHRIVDGAEAARFMNRLIQLLSDPLVWLLEG